MASFWLILKPETNWFKDLRDELKSVIRKHATIVEERRFFLSETVLDQLYADSYVRAPKSYSRDEILWVHNSKWGSSLLLLIETEMSISDFREKVVGGHEIVPNTLRGIWKLQRDNSLKFWQARGLRFIPDQPDLSAEFPMVYWSPERLSLLVNGIHCPKNEEEARSDDQALSALSAVYQS